MVRLSLVSAILLLGVQTTYGDEQSAEECIASSLEIKRTVVEQTLAALNHGKCNYYCSAYTISGHCYISLLTIVFLGLHSSYPASSCREIFNNTQNPSGYYWLQSANGSAVRVYCNMTLTCKGVSGGWMQVAKLDMTNASHQCPTGTRLRADLPKRVCGIDLDGSGCSSTIFDVQEIEYSQVCGKIVGYQEASPDAFGAHDQITRSYNIDNAYVDGISITHGTNPRHHIWTFAAALDEIGEFGLWKGYCPCTNINHPSSASQPPCFVGNDYFCDTGSEDQWEDIFYPDDPLWDGAGCGSNNTCCSLNNPPWFLRLLPLSTINDIEMRMCRDEAYYGPVEENVLIESLELYIQ